MLSDLCCLLPPGNGPGSILVFRNRFRSSFSESNHERNYMNTQGRMDKAGADQRRLMFVAAIGEGVRNFVCGAYHEESLCPADRRPTSRLLKC
jgi:hypothetical protein